MQTTEPPGDVRPLGAEQPSPGRRDRPTWLIAGAAAAAGIVFGFLVGDAWSPEASGTATTTTTAAPRASIATTTPPAPVPDLVLPQDGRTRNSLGTINWHVAALDEYVPVRPFRAGAMFAAVAGSVSTDGIEWGYPVPRPETCPGDQAVMTHRGLLRLGLLPQEQPGGFYLRTAAACLLGADWTWRPVEFVGDPPLLQGNAAAHTDEVTLLQDGDGLWTLEDDDTLDRVRLPLAVRETYMDPSVWAVGDGFVAFAEAAGSGDLTWWVSDDGATWTDMADPPNLDVVGLVAIVSRGDRALLGTRFPSNRFFVSDGGSDWRAVDPPFTAFDVRLAGGPAGFVALDIGYSTGLEHAWVSADGESWETLPTELFDVTVDGVRVTLTSMTAVVSDDAVVIYAEVDVPDIAGLVWVGTVTGD